MNININLWQSSLQIAFIGVKCSLESYTRQNHLDSTVCHNKSLHFLSPHS